jgi:uncharacterized membrane protein YfcA
MLSLIGVITVGLAAGVLSGLFGIAGGTIIVPGLMVLAGMPQLSANGSSLAANLLPVGILGVIAYWKKGLVKPGVVLPLAAGLLLGVWLGSMSAIGLPPFWHKLGFGLFLCLMSLRFFLVKGAPGGEGAPFPPHPWWGLVLTGLLAGVFSGLFGIGGGALMIPIMTELFKFNQRQAAASSLSALLLPVGIGGVLHYQAAGNVDWAAAGLIAGGLALGVLLGARLHLKSPEGVVRRAYAGYLAVVGLSFLAAAFLLDFRSSLAA